MNLKVSNFLLYLIYVLYSPDFTSISKLSWLALSTLLIILMIIMLLPVIMLIPMACFILFKKHKPYIFHVKYWPLNEYLELKDLLVNYDIVKLIGQLKKDYWYLEISKNIKYIFTGGYLLSFTLLSYKLFKITFISILLLVIITLVIFLEGYQLGKSLSDICSKQLKNTKVGLNKQFSSELNKQKIPSLSKSIQRQINNRRESNKEFKNVVSLTLSLSGVTVASLITQSTDSNTLKAFLLVCAIFMIGFFIVDLLCFYIEGKAYIETCKNLLEILKEISKK